MTEKLLVVALFHLTMMFACIYNRLLVECRSFCTKTKAYDNQSFVNDNWHESLVYLGNTGNTQECSQLLCSNSSSTMAFLSNNMCFSVTCKTACPKLQVTNPIVRSKSVIIIVERMTKDVQRVTRHQHNGTPSQRKSHEYALISDFIRKTDSNVRPVIRHSDVLKIAFSLKLVQIIDVDELAQSITFGAWTTMQWTNSLLTWKKEDHGNVSRINLSPDVVWRPTLFLYNDASSSNSHRQNLRNQQSKIILESSGVSTWFSTMVFIASCDINVRYFPFDEQFCSVRFGAWTEPSQKIDISPFSTENMLEVYLKNSEWELVNYKVVKELIHYDCCNDMTISEIVYKFHLRRRTFYYVYTFIIPCGLLTWLVLLTFVLPPSSGERMILGLTVLVAMTVYLNIASKQLPTTSDHIPLLSQYYFMLMVQITLSIILAIINLCVFFKSGDPGPVPQWARYIIVDNLGFLVNGNVTFPGFNTSTIQDSDWSTLFRRNNANKFSSDETMVSTPLNVTAADVSRPLNGTAANVSRSLNVTAETVISDSTTTDDEDDDEDDLINSYSEDETSNHLITRKPVKSTSSTHQRLTRGDDTQRSFMSTEKESVWENMGVILQNEQKKEYKKADLVQWQFVSAVVDRLHFFGFIITLVISTLSILGKPVYTDLE